MSAPGTLPKGITQRGGSFRVSIMKEGRRETATCATLAEAVEAAERIRSGRVLACADALWTLSEAAQRTVAEFVEVNATSAASIYTRSTVLHRIAAHFGPDRLLEGLTQRDVSAWRVHLHREKGLAANTINNLMGGMRVMIQHAKENGGVTPGFSLELPFLKVKRGRIRFLSEDEEASVVDYFKTSGDNDMADYVTFCTSMGFRGGEALGLAWRDVDFASGMVHLWQTKGKNSRSVTMPGHVAAMMRRRKLQAGGSGSPDHAFGSLDHPKVIRRWTTMKANMGLAEDREFVPHIMRHTFATRLLSRGLDIRTLMGLMGHEDIKTTMIYAQFIPQNAARAATLLDQTHETGRFSGASRV